MTSKVIKQKYFIQTFGCQMNKNDSEKIASILDGLNWQETKKYKDADLAILNTCSIRDKAETRVLGWLGHLKNLKEHKKNFKIAVCGCMPQHLKDDFFKKAPYIDLLFGTNTINNLPQLIFKINQGEKNVLAITENNENEELAINPKRTSQRQAWVTISYGCDNFCSYCIVPYTRGREVSRTKESIIEEIKQIDHKKYEEVTLLGQNVNSYGKGLYEKYDFADLLIDIIKETNIARISFLTSHPKDMTEKLIKVIAEEKRISRQLHIPIQAGDDKILELMNRKYTVAHYLNLLKKIRKLIPDAEISTDIIVGFPTETEGQFLNTLNLVEKACFSRVNTAMFSKRPLTKAKDMPCQVSETIKKQRLAILMQKIDELKGGL